MRKSTQYRVRGMSKDMSENVFNPDYAYHIYNMRLVPSDSNNTLLALANEKGTGLLENASDINGIPVGKATIDNKLILFTKGSESDTLADIVTSGSTDIATELSPQYSDVDNINTMFDDNIYKIEYSDTNESDVNINLLFSGKLGFDSSHPIEAISYYENSDLQKVYWTDGVNQPRVINVSAAENAISRWNIDSFNFVTSIWNLDADIEVTRDTTGAGQFPVGTIQYAFTYFNSYNQETNIFNVSPLYYISYSGKGAKSDSKVSNVFHISTANLDRNYDYLRVYSIQRTSKDATPICRIVGDYNIFSKTTESITWNAIENTSSTETVNYTTLAFADFINAEIWNSTYGVISTFYMPGDVNTLVTDIPQKYRGLANSYIRIKTANGYKLYLLSNYQTSDSYFGLMIASKVYLHKATNADTLFDYIKYAAQTGNYGYTMWNLDPHAFDDENPTTNITCKTTIAASANANINNLYSYDPTTFKQGSKVTITGDTLFSTTDTNVLYDATSGVLYKASSGTLKITSAGVVSDNTDYVFFSAVVVTNTSYSTVDIVDDGILGSSIDAAELLYVGGESITAETLEQKDGTLFLGNINISRLSVPKTVKDVVYNGEIFEKYVSSSVDLDVKKGFYQWKNQLGSSSRDMKFFKYLEYYRLGLQFQYKTGKWSDVVWIRDYRMTSPVRTITDSTISARSIPEYLVPAEVVNAMLFLGYKKVRPVVVYPTISERTVICQGIVNPTVYNVEDRYTNSPYTQASWFFRPKNPTTNEYASRGWNIDYAHNHLITGEIQCTPDIAENFNSGTKNYSTGARTPRLGATDYVISDNQDSFNASAAEATIVPVTESSQAELFVHNNKECFYVDNSIVTLNSPDLEFDSDVKTADLTNTKFRIIGYAPITSFRGDMSIETSNNPLDYYKDGSYTSSKITEPGFTKVSVGGDNDVTSGSVMSRVAFWLDELANRSVNNSSLLTTYYQVYPWNRTTLNNSPAAGFKSGDVTFTSASLKTKKMSNLRYCYNTVYFTGSGVTQWSPSNGVSDIQIFDSTEQSLIRLKGQDLGTYINYYGNIDKLVTFHQNSKTYPTDIGEYPITVENIRTKNATGNSNGTSFTGADSLLTNENKVLRELVSGSSNTLGYLLDKKYCYSNDPIYMKYKSGPHAVIAFSNHNSHQVVLPRLQSYEYDDTSDSDYVTHPAFWNQSLQGVEQDTLNVSLPSNYLYIGEIYRDKSDSMFGGISEDAFETNNWCVGGEAVDMSEGLTSTIKWTEGDTYFQRYDALKTYPYSSSEYNNMVEILSFMCETRVNIDGRYDNNRGQTSNLQMTPDNFNLLNDVYTQQPNFFEYHSINSNRLNLNKFANSLTWTVTKTAGALVDKWTDITMASTLDLDGDKGSLKKLMRFNNELLAFQDRGISNIMYNSTTSLASAAGIPIELANSGKVDGKRYLSDSLGTVNKWSICETPNGIYFIDNNVKAIYRFNGKFENISETKGMATWIKGQSSLDEWNPVNFGNFVAYYDSINEEVLFISKNYCLCYSEPLDCFTGFYSYYNTPYFVNLKDTGIFVNCDASIDGIPKGQVGNKYKLWKEHAGDYNTFFHSPEAYSIEYVVNPESNLDKIFDTTEILTDTWDKNGNLLTNIPFSLITASNEYQNGSLDLSKNHGVHYNASRKFRVWRTDIPRDSIHKMDRMRNTWIHLVLLNNSVNTNRTVLSNFIVNYFTGM